MASRAPWPIRVARRPPKKVTPAHPALSEGPCGFFGGPPGRPGFSRGRVDAKDPSKRAPAPFQGPGPEPFSGGGFWSTRPLENPGRPGGPPQKAARLLGHSRVGRSGQGAREAKKPPPKRTANGSEIGPGAQIQACTVLHFGRVVFRPQARIRGHSVRPRPPIRRHSGPRGVARSSPKSFFLATPCLQQIRKLRIEPCLRRPSENAVRNFAIVAPSQRRYADSTRKWAG